MRVQVVQVGVTRGVIMRRSIDCGGLVPECCSSTLKVEEERLFGKQGQQYCEIAPSDIIEVKEYGFNNPFIMVTTRNGRFHVGALMRQYDDVARILQRYVGSEWCYCFAHLFNVLFYRKQFKLASAIKHILCSRRDTK
jgi:hypothetical protein